MSYLLLLFIVGFLIIHVYLVLFKSNRNMRMKQLLSAVFLILMICTDSTVVAQGPPPGTPRKQVMSLSAGYRQLFHSELDEVSGDYALGISWTKLSYMRFLSMKTNLGASLSIEHSGYDFSVSADSGFNDVVSTRIGMIWGQRINQRFSLLTTAFVSESAETNADLSTAFTYGGMTGFTCAITKKISLGLALAGGNRLEGQSCLLPLPLIQVRFTDRLSLMTRRGIGLSWLPDRKKRWKLDFFLGFENRMFRLDEDSPYPDGAVEDRRVDFRIQAEYRPVPWVYMRALTGISVYQKFSYYASDGDEKRDFHSHPGCWLGVEVGIKY